MAPRRFCTACGELLLEESFNASNWAGSNKGLADQRSCLTCTAAANPPGVYKWTEQNGLINGYIFSAAMPFKSVICVIICDLMSTAHSRVK